MRILSAKIEHARNARDFGQVEALVSLIVKEDGRPVPFEVRIRTAEDSHGDHLRERLIDSAKSLYLARIDAQAEKARFAHAA